MDTEVLQFDEVERRYPDEWVLLEVVTPHNDHARTTGRLLAHSPHRQELLQARAAFRAADPSGVLAEFFTGELVPDGVAAVL